MIWWGWCAQKLPGSHTKHSYITYYKCTRDQQAQDDGVTGKPTPRNLTYLFMTIIFHKPTRVKCPSHLLFSSGFSGSGVAWMSHWCPQMASHLSMPKDAQSIPKRQSNWNPTKYPRNSESVSFPFTPWPMSLKYTYSVLLYKIHVDTNHLSSIKLSNIIIFNIIWKIRLIIQWLEMIYHQSSILI